MVFKTITNFSRYSSTKSTSSASHSFFDPSYIKQQKLSVIDGILGTSARNNSTSSPHASISTSSNFIVFDPSSVPNGNNDNQNNRERILLKKLPHKVNKNGHVNISIDSITDQFTILTLRRSNAITTKTIKINSNEFLNTNLKKPALVKAALEASKPVEEKQEILDDIEELDDNILITEEDLLKFNHQVMGKYSSQGKNNEILALYNRIKDKSLTLGIYNIVLESIPRRKNVKETTEENLTLLLNVYSDMLAHGVKPNETTYTNVIIPLLNACIKTYLAKDLNQSQQYFKIANELFNVSSCDFQTELYEKLLVCYNLLSYPGNRKIANIMLEKLGFHNILYYLGMMNLCKHSKDHQFALELYSQFKSIANSYPQLLQHQLQVYSCLIRTLVSCNQVESAAKILDQLILSIRSESGMQKDILPLLSSFVIGLAEIGLVQDAYKTMEKFDAIPWLPKLPINSLMILTDKSCDFKEIDYAFKFWEFAVVRKDFDSNVIHSDHNLVNLIGNLSSVETRATFTKLIQLSFMYGNKTNVIRLSKELLLKDSLRVELPLLNELIKFLVDNGLPKLALKIMSNQALKFDMRTNQFLSSLFGAIEKIDALEISKSLVFQKAVEEYSLIDDNIYAIYKTITTIWQTPVEDDTTAEILNYYYNILFEELNDLNNFYVEIPQEIKDFKSNLQLYCSPI